MKKIRKRTAYFKKGEQLEKALLELNKETAHCIPNGFLDLPTKPIVLIVGCPRSGSTLLMQWLASLNIFSYPSNLIARFYKNPWLGIKIQQVLLEFDPINQLEFALPTNPFVSKLGKTFGALAPSEYGYFWKQYYKNDDHILNIKQLKEIDSKSMLTQLSAFPLLTGKPLIAKGNPLNYYIEHLHEIYNKFIFINLERTPYYNAQSVLFAREAFYGNRKFWYSQKPQEYSFLKKEDAITQVAGQVVFIQKAINKALISVPETNHIRLTYEDFCSTPYKLLEVLQEKFCALGSHLEINSKKWDKYFKFKNQNETRLTLQESDYLKQRLAEYESYM